VIDLNQPHVLFYLFFIFLISNRILSKAQNIQPKCTESIQEIYLARRSKEIKETATGFMIILNLLRHLKYDFGSQFSRNLDT
jgi:hypothetical protein